MPRIDGAGADLLLDSGALVVCAGGGCITVVADASGALAALRGWRAEALAGSGRLVVVTTARLPPESPSSGKMVPV